MTTWFTSDQHFGHAGILKHCPDRPWDDVQEMNEALIKNYQEVVSPGDIVYIIGDFAFKDHAKILRRLPGQKHLIVGNHDWDKTGRISQRRQEELIKAGVAWVKDSYLLRIPANTVDGEPQWAWLAHYAHRSWPRMWKQSWHLYGHSHGNLPDAGNLSTDVGVDCWDYYPVSFNQLKKHFKRRTNIPDGA
jgi:calcineurin-like phosphoesterase family protein